jgi:hypothetical protein
MDIFVELLCWNVRGLNDPTKRSAIREFVATMRVSLVCFQETKLDVIDDFIVMQCLGPSFDGYVYVTEDTRGRGRGFCLLGTLRSWRWIGLALTRTRSQGKSFPATITGGG